MWIKEKTALHFCKTVYLGFLSYSYYGSSTSILYESGRSDPDPE